MTLRDRERRGTRIRVHLSNDHLGSSEMAELH